MRPWNGSMISTMSWTRESGREELAALLPLGHGELAEEVLVDLAEGVALDVHIDQGEGFEEGDEGVVLDPAVGLGEDVFQIGVAGPASIARMASLIALPMSAPSGRSRRVEKRAGSGR